MLRFHAILLCAAVLLLWAFPCLLFADVVPAPQGRIYAFTGASAGAGEFLVFDSVTLAQISGVTPTSHGGADLAVDDTGRLFGHFQGIGGTTYLREYDPLTFSVLNETSFPSGLTGLAARGGRLYSYTEMGSMVTFDANTLAQTSGPAPTSHGTQELAFDETGRLFGHYQVGATTNLVEYNPVSLSVIHQTSFAAGLSGLAVRNGVLYTFTDTGSLLTYDGSTLAQTSGIAPTSHPEMDLAFDQAGRLFGTYQISATTHLVQIDPITRGIINEVTFPAGITGLAAITIPEPAALGFLGFAGLLAIRRRR